MGELVVREGVVLAAFDSERGRRLAVLAAVGDEAAGDEAMARVLQQQSCAIAVEDGAGGDVAAMGDEQIVLVATAEGVDDSGTQHF
ncbi:MAG: hypothetical protein IPK22_08720 [Verrucomicrobiaceae bacterium]|nr:hypothetical protein [Verrucomicrobiaceae bacterium]